MIDLFKQKKWTKKVMKGDFLGVRELGIEAGQCIEVQGDLKFLDSHLIDPNAIHKLGGNQKKQPLEPGKRPAIMKVHIPSYIFLPGDK